MNDYEVTRGTTPTLTFSLPIDTALLTKVFITLSQGGISIIEKSLSDCTVVDSKTLTCKLTQKDTLKLRANTKTEVQIRVLTTGKDSLASPRYQIDTEKILKDGEI